MGNEAKERQEASSGVKFRLLMWKNFLLQRRHPGQTVAELLVPVLAMSLILILRSQVEPYEEEQIKYPHIKIDTLYSSNNSLLVLRGMNITEFSVAYSPSNPILESVVRDGVSKLLSKNIDYLVPQLVESFPAIANLPTINMSLVQEIVASLVTVNGYNTSESMRGIYYSEEITRSVLLAIEFPNQYYDITELPENVSYALRFPEVPRMNSFYSQGARSWRTNALFPPFPIAGPREPRDPEGGNQPGYMNELFIAVQHSISMEIISRLTGENFTSFDMFVQRYPHPPYTNDLATQALVLLFPMFVVFSFSYTAINMVRAVTMEKELQLKETMKIMGLSTWLHWTAWFCKQFLYLLVVALMLLVLLKTNWFTTSEGFSDYAVFTRTPWTVLLFFLLLYLACTIFLCFMLSGFFSTASTAALFSGIIWFLMYAPAALLSVEESVSMGLQVFTCLSVNSAMAYGFQLMLSEESSGGMQWGKFFAAVTDDSPRLLFGHVVMMIVLDAFLYMLIALYLEQVLPGAYGTPKKWYFIFQKEFWCPNNSVHFDSSKAEVANDDDATKEPDPKNLSIGVKISKLSKVFGNNIAVNNLSLNIYNNQITVLLGHNGAGKSTTISVLTGNTTASSGSVWVAGYDIQRQARAARTNLGFCPQHNVLFPELTVREHLEFFARLKGLRGDELQNEIKSLIEKLELQDKSEYQSSGLSGGQKRRLSVGIALCGGAKVVLLDEPTSGMDPSSRRGLWTLLQKEKYGRSMILTTHFMDEADYLGDRVAILSGGRLQCVGSPYFLKRHYGVGYSLVVVKGDRFDVDECTALIANYIPHATVKEDRGSEVTYALMNDRSHVFAALLTDLENKKEIIDFKNYGLTATTMEDVFMSAGSEVATLQEDSDDATTASTESLHSEPMKYYAETSSMDHLESGSGLVQGWALVRQQCAAMWLKLWLVWRRSWGVLALQVLVPATIISVSLAIFNYLARLADPVQARALDLRQGFRHTETYLSYNGSSSSSVGYAVYEAYQQLFNNDNRRLVNLANQNIEDYYLEKGSDQITLGSMRSEVIIGASFSAASATAWFSNFGYHDVAVSVATLHNALLRSLRPLAHIAVTNHPLEANYENSSDLQFVVTVLSMNLANAIGNCLTMLSAVFVMFYIKERVSRAKLLQKASGIEPVVMWGSALVFDWLWFMTVCIIFIIACTAFQVQSMSSVDELGRLYVVFMVYGVSMLPFIYIMSYFFAVPAYGFVVVMFINILFGLMGAQIVEALQNLDTDPAPQIMDGILQFFPLYSASFSVRRLHEAALTEWSCLQLCGVLGGVLPGQACDLDLVCQNFNTACCVRENPYFEWEAPGVLRYLLCMLLSGAVLWLLLMFVEYRLHKKISFRRASPPVVDASTQDEDVVSESKHVEYIGDSALRHHNLVARKLTKYYKKHLAVNQVSFSVGEMECFGLLGVNGAGKTTTFKMLMGDETISAGDAFVRGHSVRTDIKNVHAYIGYCPQFDAVFPELTGRETLRLFGMLRGLRPEHANDRTIALAAALGFTRHLDKQVCQYSGGNKRKLSTAVALTGVARVVFLDEPTTGVDPAAKRQVWRAVRRATSTGRSVVLTSHSMEECEALCSRLTIMVNGQFMCLGTPQHLKNKYSQGFTLTIKMKTECESLLAETNALKNFITSNFTNPKLMEEYEGLLTYYLPERSMPWSTMFAVMERAKSTYPVEDYNISQTTLEQIFLQFTKYQRETNNAE